MKHYFRVVGIHALPPVHQTGYDLPFDYPNNHLLHRDHFGGGDDENGGILADLLEAHGQI